MKVIVMPNTNWTHKHTCANCTAVLEVEKTDVKYYSYPGDQRESGYEIWSATCPVCHVQFTIPETTIPKPVQVEIKQGESNTTGHGGSGSYFDR